MQRMLQQIRPDGELNRGTAGTRPSHSLRSWRSRPRAKMPSRTSINGARFAGLNHPVGQLCRGEQMAVPLIPYIGVAIGDEVFITRTLVIGFANILRRFALRDDSS